MIRQTPGPLEGPVAPAAVILCDQDGIPYVAQGSGTGVVRGSLSNNTAAPTNNNVGVLPAVASASPPSYTEGNQVLLSVDLDGNLRSIATIDPTGLATEAQQIIGNASLSILDDWDESDRAKVNPIVGQAGVEAGAGAVTAKTQRVAFATDANTVQISGTIPVSIVNNKTIKSLSGTFDADADLVGAVAARRIKVLGYAFFTFDTDVTVILLKSGGASGTLLWTVCLQAITSSVMGANMTTALPGFIFATAAGEQLTADTNTSATVFWSISYYDDDGT